ncbi:DUF998 domain-containing protein [Nocardia sp. NPDC006630]|uniref:DUF998 domain-containing protein n=1 Tax=Nocardia sp. NPDC006630 TaxID=3157181 RepID=UPI0033B7C932
MAVSVHTDRCDRETAVTRSLLGYGILAGPCYLIAGLIEASTRQGYRIAHHDLSLLANGPLGWIHITVLVVTGVMVLAAATGLRRALAGQPGGAWGPGLIGGYGLGLIAAGVLIADPMNGFPTGTPAGKPVHPTLHGTGHLIAGAVGFGCLIAAMFLFAWAFRRANRPGWAWYSLVSGIVFLAGWVGIATGSDSAVIVLAFWVAVAAGFAWLAAVSAALYRALAPAREALSPSREGAPQ